MKVMAVQNSIPKIVKRFANLLWVNVPMAWKMHELYHKNKLHVTILIEDEDGEITKVQRAYRLKDLKKCKDDIWGLAEVCAKEIIHASREV